MSSLSLLLLYSAALFASSYAGGKLPRYFAMTHTRAQLAMSFVSGVMLGIAFLHLLPHALAAAHGEHAASSTMAWAVTGLVVMLLLLRLLHFHQPDYPTEAAHACGHDHDHNPAGTTGAGDQRASSLQADANLRPDPAPAVGWRGVLVGLVFHTFIDGMALGAVMIGVPHQHEGSILGVGLFLAILLHKPLDALSITALMKAGGAEDKTQNRANVLFAIVCPIGALLFFFAVGGNAGLQAEVLVPALAFSAGAFICIALGDLLPEVQFHSHDRLKLTVVFLAGIAVAYLMELAAPQHSHAIGAARSVVTG